MLCILAWLAPCVHTSTDVWIIPKPSSTLGGMSTLAYPELVTPHFAGEALTKNRIVYLTADDKASHATDPALHVPAGVMLRPGASGTTVDVARTGIASVEYGEAISVGDPVVCGADGKAYSALLHPEARYTLGTADTSGAAGDIGRVHIAPHALAQTRRYTAGEALVAHRVVKLHANDTTVRYADAHEIGIGITLAAAENTAVVAVALTGVAKATSSAAVTRGNMVSAATDGKVDDAANDASDRRRVIGLALTAASGANKTILVRLAPSMI